MFVLFFLNFPMYYLKFIIDFHTIKIIHASLLCKKEIDVNG